MEIVDEINAAIVSENPEDFSEEEKAEYVGPEVDTSNMTYEEMEWNIGQ